MNRIDGLRKNYARYVSLPWDHSLPGGQRIWFAVYDPVDERRLRLLLPTFEITTKQKPANHGWARCDLRDAFATWMAAQDYHAAYFESPEDLPNPHPGFEDYVAGRVRSVLDSSDGNTVVALTGVASLFGFMKVSALMERVEDAIRGRLLVFFPGEYQENHYRLLDARDGWNYHAVPITAAAAMEGA